MTEKHISAHRADATLFADNVGCKKCRVGSVSRNKIVYKAQMSISLWFTKNWVQVQPANFWQNK